MKKYIYMVILLPILLAGCHKDFLTQTPKTQLTAASAFSSYANFETYTWGLYDYFNGYGNGGGIYPNNFDSEYNSDNLSWTLAGNQSGYAFQTKIIPGSNSSEDAQSSLCIAGWDFTYIRRVNVMLDNIDQSAMVQSDKDHWRSVGYFFRALRYYDLIAAFGDVPWIEHELTDTSNSVLFGPRTPRATVAANILSNLEFAETHIKPAGDGVNTINVNCVRALLSRFCLFEGTWEKYHAVTNANSALYLQACATYSAKLLPAFPTIMSSYDDVFNTEDLTGQPGIILFKQYAANYTDHEVGKRVMGSTSWNMDVSKDAVDSYLCTDGQPVSTSAVYNGDTSMYSQFRNRDRRLYYTVVPPYKVTEGSPNSTYSLTSNPADAEYINLMNSISPSNKRLPVLQWGGIVISTAPHFYLFNAGQSQAISQLGFFFWKYYNQLPFDVNSYSTNDCPLFRIEEVMLNYAEAEFELGSFSQAIADQTINKLRPRANLPNMIVANIGASFDLNRDPTVDPVLWEIRRERRVELMGDGFRFNDLKRWNKGTYFNKQQLGVYVNNANFGNALTISGGGKTGYVQFYPVPTGWLDKYYLEPVPKDQLVLNPSLKQTTGW